MDLGFNYCDVKEWTNYFENDIKPIRDKAEMLLRFWEQLSDNCASLSIFEIKDKKYLLENLMGGLRINGEYSNKSIALFYEEFFGWKLENAFSYLKNQEIGIDFEVFTKIEETEFIQFLRKLIEQCEVILNIAFEEEIIHSPEIIDKGIEFKNLLESDEELIYLIAELYESILRFTINHNEKTLFLWTIRKITKRHLCFQYKELCESKGFDILRNRFGLTIFFSPKIEENTEVAKKILDEYTIWFFRESGLGFNICDLNNFIFEQFNETSIYGSNKLWDRLRFLFPNHNSLEIEYFEYAKRNLSYWQMPDYIDTMEWGGSKKPSWHYAYVIDGAYLPRVYEIPSWSNYSPKLVNANFNKSLSDFLDDISPGLFLGLIKPENLIIEKEMSNDLIRIKE